MQLAVWKMRVKYEDVTELLEDYTRFTIFRKFRTGLRIIWSVPMEFFSCNHSDG